MSLRFIKPVTITDAMVTGGNLWEESPDQWEMLLSYSQYATVSTGRSGGIFGGAISVWLSLANSNIGNDPDTDDGTWWELIGTTYDPWDSSITYPAGGRVLDVTTHRVYESVQAGNLNHAHTTDDGTWWVDIGPTNAWSMFDRTVGSASSNPKQFHVSFTPGPINSLALLDIAGEQLTVTMKDQPGGSTVFALNYNIADGAQITDWYDYFFEEIVPESLMIIEDLPTYAGCELMVNISAATGNVEIGTLAAGNAVEIGQVKAGARIGIIDYSRKETDAYGVTTLVERAYAKRFDLDVVLENSRVDYIAKALAAVRATPCVWVGDEQFDSLVAYGWVRDWGISVAYSSHSDANFVIEGLT